MEKFNDDMKEGLASMLEVGMQEEDLGRVQVARILKCSETVVSQIKNPSYRKMVPNSIWVRIKQWVDSENSLKEFESLGHMEPPAENTVVIHKVKAGKEEIKMIKPNNPTFFVIEKDIPIPPKVGKDILYPFNLMEAGDSFKILIGDEPPKKIVSRLHTSIKRYVKELPSRKFIVRTLKAEGIIRCWRTE